MWEQKVAPKDPPPTPVPRWFGVIVSQLLLLNTHFLLPVVHTLPHSFHTMT